MDLLSSLGALASSDLEAVAANRPEAASLRGRAESHLPELAARVGQPYAVERAASRLDRFHLQLLQLACVLGGRLDRDTAASQGVPVDTLGPAALQLARLALAFPDPGGGLVVPTEVQAAISYRRSLGAALRPLLEAETVEDLKRVARAVGASASRKAELVEAIHSRLSDADVVRSLLGGAPPKSRRALDVIRKAGGEASLRRLMDELGPSVYEFRNTWRRHLARDESGLVWLWSRGLIFRDSWEGRVLVPAPVEVALRGRAFPSWETAAPELELAPAVFDRAPQALVEEVSRLLRAVAETELPLLKSGEIGIKECRRVAAELGLEEQPARWLLDLAWRVGLLDTRVEPPRAGRRRGRRDASDERRFLTVTASGRRWLTTDTAEAWLAIFDGWRQAVDGSPTASTTPGHEVLQAIATLPPEQGTTVASLGRRLSWQMPAVWPDDESGADAVAAMRSQLALLGVCPVSGVVALSEPGRTALDGGGVEAIRAVLPAGVETCAVQADMTVVVAGPPSAALAAGLARFADLETSGTARVYRLSERSVGRALDQGMTAGEIERLLATHSPSGLPGPVQELIRDVGRRHGRLRVGTASVYITGEDAAVLAEALASSRVRGLEPRLLAPTVAVVEGRTRAQVVDALRKSGQMPAVDAGAADVAAEPADESPVRARPRRGSVTDPEVLERRRRALEHARQASRVRLAQRAEPP